MKAGVVANDCKYHLFIFISVHVLCKWHKTKKNTKISGFLVKKLQVAEEGLEPPTRGL